jgi:thiol-disulfide isomerase/thioredoxin
MKEDNLMKISNIKWPLRMAMIAMVVLMTACGNGSQSNQASPTISTTVNEGKIAPMFDLVDLHGNKVALGDLAGEKVYVKYWASWCSICLAGMDELNTLSTQDNDFKVISVVSPNFKGEQSTEDFTNWFKKLTTNQDITVLIDEGGTWAKKFGVRGYPTSYYIGSDGVLAKTTPGHNYNEQITSTFEGIN